MEKISERECNECASCGRQKHSGCTKVGASGRASLLGVFSRVIVIVYLAI